MKFIMSAMCSAVMIFAFAAITLRVEVASSGEAGEEKWVEWGLPLVLREKPSDEIEKTARRLHAGLGSQWPMRHSNVSPGCCLYLDVGRLMPVGEPGFVVVVRHTGGLVMATDEDQFAKAVDAILRVADSTGGRVRLPVGVLTNYAIVDDKRNRSGAGEK